MASSEKQVYHFTAEVKDVEIRRIEDIDASFTDKNGKLVESHYIKLTCDAGENVDRVFFKDKNMENLKKYKPRMVGTFFIRIDVEEDFGSKAKFLVTDFKENGVDEEESKSKKKGGK